MLVKVTVENFILYHCKKGKMMTRYLAITTCLFVSLFAASVTHAACTNKTIFACTTSKGKFVEVCDADKTIQYAFGKKGAKPELALTIPRAAASTRQWDGMGRYMSYSVQIPNGNTVYEVFSSVDKMTEEGESGINVEIAGKHAATLTCKAETVINNIEGISLKPAP